MQKNQNLEADGDEIDEVLPPLTDLAAVPEELAKPISPAEPLAADESPETAEDHPLQDEAVETGQPEAERPDDVPEKFWDAETGSVRTEALLKSYGELEKRLSRMLPNPEDADAEDMQRLRSALGVPAAVDGYEIDLDEGILEADPEVNQKLFELGFTQSQAQLVYDLARDHLMPAMADMQAEIELQQEMSRLQGVFGGAEAWQGVAKQIRTWAEANVAPEVYTTLSGSYDGVMALHAMMQKQEPQVVESSGNTGSGDADGLRQMMQDPRYWRDRDQSFVAEVTKGFEQLFRT